MNVYHLMPGADGDRYAVGYELRAAPGAGPMWPKGAWDPVTAFADRELTDQVPLSTEIRKNLPRLTAVMRPATGEMSDVVGSFYPILAAPPPLVSSGLRALIETLAPDTIETLAPPRCWDALNESDLDPRDHAFVNVVRCIDSWDKEKAEVNLMTRRDGTTWHALGRRQIIDPNAVGEAHLWRDARTHHILCSEVFKRQAEALSVTNLDFIAVMA